MSKMTPSEFTAYIDEFQYWANKRLNWWLKYPLYLPFGAMIEWYWIKKMAEINKKFEDNNLSTL